MKLSMKAQGCGRLKARITQYIGGQKVITTKRRRKIHESLEPVDRREVGGKNRDCQRWLNGETSRGSAAKCGVESEALNIKRSMPVFLKRRKAKIHRERGK